MEPLRIQKWIAQLGMASRREAERWIVEGRVRVNGQVCSLGSKIDVDEDLVSIDGKPILKKANPPKIYWMLHKPDGVLTSRVDGFQRPTIYDLPKLRKLPFLVSPVGRLDFRTEGMLLLTNDGELANQLTHPRSKVPRHYHVLISGRLSKEQETKISSGTLELEDGPVKQAHIRYAHRHPLGASSGSWYMLTVYEGRNRIVRRIFKSLGFKVVRLIRVGMGDLRMPEQLGPGDYCQLNKDQIESLKRAVGAFRPRSRRPQEEPTSGSLTPDLPAKRRLLLSQDGPVA